MKQPARPLIFRSIYVSEFSRARRVMAKKLRDTDLRQCYVANIAMLLYDRYGLADHEGEYFTCNRAAEDILKLVFEQDSGE